MGNNNMMLFALVLLPMLGAFATRVLCGQETKPCRKRGAICSICVAVVEFAIVLFLAVPVLTGQVKFAGMELIASEATQGVAYVCRIDGFTAFGLDFKMDGFRAFYLVILCFMWMTSVVFSPEYMGHHENHGRYYFYTLLTLGATVGVFLSADLMTTFLFFEIMSFTSYVWVAQEETKESLRAAQTYLAVAVLGGMVMLMGVFLLYHMTGTLNLSELKEACAAVENRSLLMVAGCLMLFGFGAKAGMFPLHIWLPKAHPVAPAPASALLSGVLTKAGIFGVILLAGSVLAGEETFGWIVLVLGTITMLLGAILGVFSIDLKRTFACSSVSQIGFILTGLGMMNLIEESALATEGAFLHMMNHSLIKLVLFLLAGIVYQNLHSLNLNEVRGFGKGKPFFLAAYVSAAFAIGGLPFFSGYVSKTMLHEAIVEGTEVFSGDMGSLLKTTEWLFLISGGLTVAYMLKVFVILFVEKPSTTVVEHNKKNYVSLPVKLLLAVPAIVFPVFGILPNQIMVSLAKRTAEFFYGGIECEELEESIAFFSFGNLKGALISITIGLAVYFLIVRTWLRVKTTEGYEYVNRIPKWMDLENTVYRPVFVQFLSFLFATICRIPDKLVNGIAFLTSNTVLAEVKPAKERYIGSKFAYLVGSLMDGIVKIMNKTVRRKNPIEKSYVLLLAVGEEETARTVRLVTRSVSYGLMLACIGLLLTMIYLLMYA